jgi:hypothetical protein
MRGQLRERTVVGVLQAETGTLMLRQRGNYSSSSALNLF